jgi:ABC-type Na+ efflux pump permease subunit
MVMVELSGSDTKEGIATAIALQYCVAPVILTFTVTFAISVAIQS